MRSILSLLAMAVVSVSSAVSYAGDVAAQYGHSHWTAYANVRPEIDAYKAATESDFIDLSQMRSDCQSEKANIISKVAACRAILNGPDFTGTSTQKTTFLADCTGYDTARDSVSADMIAHNTTYNNIDSYMASAGYNYAQGDGYSNEAQACFNYFNAAWIDYWNANQAMPGNLASWTADDASLDSILTDVTNLYDDLVANYGGGGPE
jgi:hypothetical protein